LYLGDVKNTVANLTEQFSLAKLQCRMKMNSFIFQVLAKHSAKAKMKQGYCTQAYPRGGGVSWNPLQPVILMFSEWLQI
jgi:hypothetical protein